MIKTKIKPIYYKLPAIISILVVGITPIIFQFYISLHSLALGFPWSKRNFVGLNNFKQILTSKSVMHSLKLTIIFTFLVTIISLTIGLLMAIILNRKFKFKYIVVTSVLVPQIISPSVLGLIWRLMYNTDYGIINYFLKPFGLEQIWLGKDLAFTSVVITSVWFASSFMTLISLAGLQNLPPSIYEAAKIDGANKIRVFWNITLPMLKPILGIGVLLQQVACLHIFGLVYTLTGGGPGERTNLLSLEVYREGLNSGFIGIGAGIALILAILALLVSVVFIKIMGREFL